MLSEMNEFSVLYVSAFVRRFAILAQLETAQEPNSVAKEGDTVAKEGDKTPLEVGSAQWEEAIIKACLAAPSIREIIEAADKRETTETDMDLLESAMDRSIFVSGLASLSRHRPLESMSLSERRKALFGSDALFS